MGSPFSAGAERSGRARLESYYRDLGFRDVQVETTATPASQGMDMALTFAVKEGPLHVISAVEIEGVQSTRPSLVSKAVQLTPGQPAGAAAAAATEKRLYSSGPSGARKFGSSRFLLLGRSRGPFRSRR